MGDPDDRRQAQQRIRRCLSGDRQAMAEFQQLYGETIYGFAMRAFRLTADEAGDFYVWAFDKGRIFRRVRSYAGRAPFRAYLVGCVLDHLLVEWTRGRQRLETVPLEAVGEVADPATVGGEEGTTGGRSAALAEALAGLDPERVLIMKLLHIEDWELTPEEIRRIAARSGRPAGEVLRGIEQLRAAVREREARQKEIEESLDGVQSWIRAYRRRLAEVEGELAAGPAGGLRAARLRQQAAELRRKIAWRENQRTRLLQRARRRKVTAPYAAIADLLGTTVGNVGSQIARLRRELERRAAGGQG